MAIVLLVLASAYICVVWIPRLLVAATGLALAICISRRVKLTTHRIIENRAGDLGCDRKPNRAERRVMRESLRLALDQTELRSLFSSVMAQADTMTS